MHADVNLNGTRDGSPWHALTCTISCSRVLTFRTVANMPPTSRRRSGSNPVFNPSTGDSRHPYLMQCGLVAGPAAKAEVRVVFGPDGCLVALAEAAGRERSHPDLTSGLPSRTYAGSNIGSNIGAPTRHHRFRHRFGRQEAPPCAPVARTTHLCGVDRTKSESTQMGHPSQLVRAADRCSRSRTSSRCLGGRES